MDFDVTREQWVDRFVIRISNQRPGAEPGEFVDLANSLWPAKGHLGPEAAADAEAAAPAGESYPFETTQRLGGETLFERTERIPVERLQADGEYVRDNDEWIARCIGRVLQLDPIIKAEEARRSVTGLAGLERWRLMKPEAAAEQLYTPIRPHTA